MRPLTRCNRGTDTRSDRRFHRPPINRQPSDYYGAPTVELRTDFQATPQLTDSFSHSSDSNSRLASQIHFYSLLWRYTLAFVLHFNSQVPVALGNPNLSN